MRSVRTISGRFLRSGLLVAVSVIAGCAFYDRTTVFVPPIPPAKSVDATVDGTKVALARTQQLELRLPSNATTGYRWSYVLSGDLMLYPSGVTPVFAPDTAAEGQTPVGAGGLSVFTFRADGVGTTHVKFEYRRPWEGNDVPPAKVIAFDATAP
jgi:predicted secreted protein